MRSLMRLGSVVVLILGLVTTGLVSVSLVAQAEPSGKCSRGSGSCVVRGGGGSHDSPPHLGVG